MDPTTLPGLPAPFWFVELFKGIGFFLHLIPMHLWFAGLPLAILALLVGGPQAKRYSRRMFAQMPVILALGVNFAIVPLLFLQTAYYKSFYTATILSAWLWLAIIPLFLLAYYGVYLCSFAIKKHFATSATVEGEKGKKEGKPEKTANPGKYQAVLVGLAVWCCLVAVGVLITHALTLMGKPEAWDSIWKQTQIAGAVTGLGNLLGESALWLRLAGMFGLALITTGFWAVFDSHVLMKEEAAYRKWTISYAARVSWIGLIVSASAFSYYFWLLDGDEGMKFLFQFPWCLFPMFLLVLPLLSSVFLAYSRQSNHVIRPLALFGLTLGEVGLLGSFVVTRQLIQNAQVGRFLQVELLPVSVQWSPLLAFLVVFTIGACVIAWIVRQLSQL